MSMHPLLELELSQIQEEFNNGDAESRTAYMKEQLRGYVEQLQTLEKEQTRLDVELKQITKSINEVKRTIYKEWSPFVNGADKSELNFDGCKLVMEPLLTVTMENSDEATDWLLNNGFKDVMKYQIHAQTFKKIGRDLYKNEKNPTMIPGVKYDEIQIVKLKK